MYRLILIFTCAGCNPPTADVTPIIPYTQTQCQIAGAVWMTPNSNPTKTVRTFVCRKQK